MIVLSAVLLSAVVCTLVQAQPVTPQCFGVVHAHAEAVGAINVYFNNSALHQYALPDNRANSCINLEERLLHRLSQGQTTIDLATYEINLPRIAEALIVRGVRVRVIADGKDLRDSDAQIRFPRMQLLLEKMLRGQDGTLNTADDVHLFSESPILAVDNPGLRAGADLPAAFYDLLAFSAQVGGQPLSGRLVAGGERKSTGDFFASRPKMYNKFAIIDGAWVFTGSWNFTLLRYK